jgi:cytochrome c oxidase cbb3-type subunit 3
MTRAGEERPIMDHEYDGIKEYDNPMPRWWVLLFWATIIFVPIYYLLPGDTGAGGKKDAMYAREIAAFEASHPNAAGPAETAEQLAVIVADVKQVSAGRALFAVNCVSCHRPDGGGLIGPNLTDDAWIHGGSPLEIHTTIWTGVLAKGMPPWGKMLKPDQVNALTAFVVSLHGTNPANAKAPEGTIAGAAATAAPAAAAISPKN